MRLVHTFGLQLKDPPQSAIDRGATNRSVYLGGSSFGSYPTLSASEEMADVHKMTYESVRATAVEVEGIYCQSIEGVIESKTALARPVDVADLHLISERMGIVLDIPEVAPKPPANS
jgi:hypothetical protein